MAKYLVMMAAALALSVQMDRDGRVETYATDYDLRPGDRVQVLPNGKVGPI